MEDLAPTVLALLGVVQPPEMTGESLIVSPDGYPQLHDGPVWTRPPKEGLPA